MELLLGLESLHGVTRCQHVELPVSPQRTCIRMAFDVFI